MLNTATDLKSVGQPEYTDTMTSTSLQNRDRAPSHLAVSEVKNTETLSLSLPKELGFFHDKVHSSNKAM